VRAGRCGNRRRDPPQPDAATHAGWIDIDLNGFRLTRFRENSI
jgi:hypothetical protein